MNGENTRIERITLAEAHRRMAEQKVSDQRHIAFCCPTCGTVQSQASLLAAGCPEADIEQSIAFSCEGRFSNAGPWPSSGNNSLCVQQRRLIRGCDETLGGLFQVHRLEITMPDQDRPQPCFEIADPEPAQELELLLHQRLAGLQAPDTGITNMAFGSDDPVRSGDYSRNIQS